MRIVVCVKQIPKLAEVQFDKSNRIVREGVELEVNPLDLEALGQALALRDAAGGESSVVALTMGPPSAREALEEAIGRGADRAVHLVDRRFAGGDTLATARALVRALERQEADVVLFGRSTLDGATAQVGPQVAELLGVAQITQVTAVETADEGRLRAVRETERGHETWTSATPVVLCVERGPQPPEPDADRAEAARVDEVTAEELGLEPGQVGTRGSPTFVQRVVEIAQERSRERLEDVEEASRRAATLGVSLEPDVAVRRREAKEHARAIWVPVERDGERLHPLTLEAIACARSVATQLDAEVVAVLPAADAAGLPQQLADHGADRVLVVCDPVLAEFSTSAFTDALAAALDEEPQPIAIIGPWTSQGRDYLPRLAARRDLGLVGDFVRFEVDDDGEDEPELGWVKPAWAGTVEAPILCHRAPGMGTLRPGSFRPLPPEDIASPLVRYLHPELSPAAEPECEDRTVEHEDDLLDHARVLVLCGEGLEDPDVAHRLAEAAGGAVGATAGAVAAGRLPRRLEVSVARRSLSPVLVIALGVHDADDLDAVRAARRVIAVNPDEDAPVHEHADLVALADPAPFAEAAVTAFARAADERLSAPRIEVREDEPGVEHVDVVVVGGRVAGCAAAIPLARAGRSVVCLDRTRFPADTLSTHSCQTAHTYEFAELGVLDKLLALDPPRLEWVMVCDGRTMLKEHFPEFAGYRYGLSIRRSDMDVAIRETAREVGVELREQVSVADVIRERGRIVGVRCRDMLDQRQYEIRAKLIIGADGRSSIVAEKIGVGEPYRASKNGRSFAYWYMDDPKVGTFWHHGYSLLRGSAAHGLVVPMPEGRMIINFMGPDDKVDLAREDPEALWDWWKKADQWIAWRVEGGTNVEGPITTKKLTAFYRASSGPGWALTGDAGHFKDPYIGQGIRDGLRFSRILGERAAVLLDDPQLLDRGLREWERERDAGTMSSYHWANRETRIDIGADAIAAEALRTFQARSDSLLTETFARRTNYEDVMHPKRSVRWLARAMLRGSVDRGALLKTALRETRADLDTRLERRRGELRPRREAATENRVGLDSW